MCIAYVDPGNLEADLQVGRGAAVCWCAGWRCLPAERLPLPAAHPSLPCIPTQPHTQTGATTGYSLLWVLLWSTAMGFLLQSLAARL